MRPIGDFYVADGDTVEITIAEEWYCLRSGTLFAMVEVEGTTYLLRQHQAEPLALTLASRDYTPPHPIKIARNGYNFVVSEVVE